MNGVQIFRLADHLAGQTAFLFEQHRNLAADHGVLQFTLLLIDQRLETLEPVALDVLGHLIALGGRGAGAGGILEGKGGAVAGGPDQIERGLEILFGLFGETDDEIARQMQIGTHLAQPVDQLQIAFGGMGAVHPLEDLVRTGLHRQVQIGHQLVTLAMRRDQIVGHVVGMRGGVADSGQPVDLAQAPDQPRQRPVAAFSGAVIGVDVLPQQGELAHPAIHQIAGLVEHLRRRARDLGAAGVGHDTEGAKLVAAFLDSEKGGRAARRLGARFQPFELVFLGEIGVERLGPLARLRLHLGQAVIALRADHQIDQRLAAHDLLALGLRDAAGNADLEIGFLGLQPLVAAQLGIDLFRRLFTDMAGVEQDHVGVVRRRRLDIALPAQRLGHAFAVIDVHLTAIGLDKELLRFGLQVGHWGIPRTRV